MKFKTLSFLTIIMFSIVGLLLISTTLHEYSHVRDFKEIAIDGQVCILNIPTDYTQLFNLSYSADIPVGYYKFKHAADNETESYFEEKDKTTEIKAYSFDFVMVLLYFVCLIVTLKTWREYGRYED